MKEKTRHDTTRLAKIREEEREEKKRRTGQDNARQNRTNPSSSALLRGNDVIPPPPPPSPFHTKFPLSIKTPPLPSHKCFTLIHSLQPTCTSMCPGLSVSLQPTFAHRTSVSLIVRENACPRRAAPRLNGQKMQQAGTAACRGNCKSMTKTDTTQHIVNYIFILFTHYISKRRYEHCLKNERAITKGNAAEIPVLSSVTQKLTQVKFHF